MPSKQVLHIALRRHAVFHAGPSEDINWITTSGSGSMTLAGRRFREFGNRKAHAHNGNAVMFTAGKILTLGGAMSFATPSFPAVKAANVIELGAVGADVTVRRVRNMRIARTYSNSVALPDGRVFVHGGSAVPKEFNDDMAIFQPGAPPLPASCASHIRHRAVRAAAANLTVTEALNRLRV